VIESSGLTDNLNLAQSLGLQNTNLTISSVYNHCQKNMSVWKVLNLAQTFNLDEHLNLNKYTGDISSEFDKLDVNLSGIVLLDKKGKKTVKDFLNTGVSDLNFTSISKQLSMPLFKKNLHVTAEKLQINSKTAPEPFKTDLNNEAASLKELDSWIQSNMMPNIEILKGNIRNLQANSSHIQVNVNATLSKVDSAQTLLHTKALGIIKSVSITEGFVCISKKNL
ncbi:hypothetical protein scyTo_0021512, partial [Scyliorhinus torazame]|nr:hypothetical protein [Scyliorhinus torazame]